MIYVVPNYSDCDYAPPRLVGYQFHDDAPSAALVAAAAQDRDSLGADAPLSGETVDEWRKRVIAAHKEAAERAKWVRAPARREYYR